MDLPLLSWLEKYTFPYEAMFKNLECARNIYAKCIRRHLRNGSTTVCFYGTIHLEATKLLADLVHSSGNYIKKFKAFYFLKTYIFLVQ